MAHRSTKDSLRLLLGGDVMLGRGVNEVIARTGPAYPLEALAALTRAADLFFVNLECAFSAAERRYAGPPKRFYFRADPKAVGTLRHAGVDLVSLANNHALDAGEEGLLDTLRLLEMQHIACVGAGADLEAASRPAFSESRGLLLGVLAYCDHQADFAAGHGRPGIRYLDLSSSSAQATLTDEVAALAAQVDHAVVSLHWQPNWVPHVPASYRVLARRLVEAGARIVWGHSPHHFQGVEWIGNSAVLYATGDLLDDYAVDPDFRNDRQLLFQLGLNEEGVEQVLAYPIELSFGRTQAASAGAWQWIAQRFAGMCAEVGSRLQQRGTWLEVLAAS